MIVTQTNLNNIKSFVQNYDTKLKSVQANVNTFKTNLNTNFDSTNNLVYGSFNGVDCRVVG
jgi:hypothetical protein